MALVGLGFEQWLFKRKIDKLAGGAVVDWNSGPVVEKIEKAIARENKRGAYKLMGNARMIVKQQAYDTGALMRSITAAPSKFGYSASVSYQKKVMIKWVVWAGNENIDYAGHVELGRYFKDAGTRVPAVPYMRSAAAKTRKWLRPRMKEAIRRALR